MTKDLTRGNPVSVILQFTVPILLGLLLQQVYNLVDTMIVGKFVGLDALGRRGVHGLAELYGAGLLYRTLHGLRHSHGQLLRSRGTQTAPAVCGQQHLSLCHRLGAGDGGGHSLLPRDSHGDAHHAGEFSYAFDYIYWIFWGIPFVMLYNMTSSMIRAVGDSKSPLLFLAVAAAINVGLDLLFILVFHLGVAGAAWATNLSQGISGLLCLFYIRKKLPIFRFEPGELAWRRAEVLHLLANGFPMSLQYFITSIGSITLQSAVNGLGTIYVNALAAGGKIAQMLQCPFEALGPAMATYTGQNVGAHRLRRIPGGLKVVVLLSVLFAVLYVTITWFFTPAIALLFLQTPDEALIALMRQFLLIVGVFSWTLGLVNGFRFSIQGMGYAQLAILSGVTEMAARVWGVALVLVPWLGYVGACLGSPVAWLLADCFLVPTALWCLRRLRQRIPEDAPEI